MGNIRCKICGGNTGVPAGQAFGTCRCCGLEITLPKTEDEHTIEEFNRGNGMRREEKPFEVFVCCKDRGENKGRASSDEKLAGEICSRLRAQGHKVFFDLESAGNKQEEWDKYVTEALDSAKVMVVLGGEPGYFDDERVKNEWSRYLSLAQKDENKLLIPCYRGMELNELPDELQALEPCNMSRKGSLKFLIRCINRALKNDGTASREAGGNVDSEQNPLPPSNELEPDQLMVKADAFLKKGSWEEAEECFDKALEADPENAGAYFGRALSKIKCSTLKDFIYKHHNETEEGKRITACEENTEIINGAVQRNVVPGYFSEEDIRKNFGSFDRTYLSDTNMLRDELEAAKTLFDGEDDFGKAFRYANVDFSKRLGEAKNERIALIEKRLKESEEKDEEKSRRIKEKYKIFLDKMEKETGSMNLEALHQRETDYKEAIEKQKTAKTSEEYKNLAELFEQLSDYKDSASWAGICRSLEKSKGEEENKNKNVVVKAVIAAAAAIAAVTIITRVILPNNRYNKAKELMESGDYESAAAEFSALGDFRDSAKQVTRVPYLKAEDLLKAGDKIHAAMAFGSLGYYEDAQARAEEIWKSITKRKMISCGSTHSVALKSKGTVVAEGRNDCGQCNVSDWTDITAVSAGSKHTVGLKSNGTVVATGDNSYGQCDTLVWTNIVAVYAGDAHTLGLKSDGTVVAAGSNEFGQCDVSGWTDIIAVAGGGGFSVGLKADGTAVAVGLNYYGQCNVSDWTGITAIETSEYHTVGIKSDGTMVAVGSNNFGQSNVSSVSGVIDVAASMFNTVCAKSDGTVVVLGRRHNSVAGWTDIVEVAAGFEDDVHGGHTVGLKSDGTVVAVGNNYYYQCRISDRKDIRRPD